MGKSPLSTGQGRESVYNPRLLVLQHVWRINRVLRHPA